MAVFFILWYDIENGIFCEFPKENCSENGGLLC